ncbi:MAG TPA: hypothetical protein VFF67_00090 [Thermoplasmata archaeon]|nr:hypothetical protein [Thermoplasmata archaeon]
MRAGAVVDRLLRSEEPSIRWKTRVNVLGESRGSRRVRALGDEVRRSRRIRTILSQGDPKGSVAAARGVYAKWQGAHWILAHLADLGYPPGDATLEPLCDRTLGVWLRASYYAEFEAATRAASYGRTGVPLMEGRYRRCASQQGNALRSITALELDDGRCAQLVERLLHWQWPDGGWNCDTHPEAHVSSFHETLLPMRGLALYGVRNRATKASRAARRASELFLTRRMFRRRSTGTTMAADFVRLHYPAYWHYDVLGGLRAMAELGRIRDARCGDALDLLEGKRLPDGGWPAEAKYYTTSSEYRGGGEFVDWGGTALRRSNPWVTVDALSVLRSAGRLEL